MDITTLALAKAYTDQKVEDAVIGSVDLSDYAKRNEIPTVQDIINALPKYNGEVE